VLAAVLAARPRRCAGFAAKSKQAQGFFEPLARTAPRPRIEVIDLTRAGAQSYAGVMVLQRDLVARRIASTDGSGDALILVEHAPVYTLGRGATLEHVLFDADLPGAPELTRVERGGDVTYHGPGQLVAYPVLDLRSYKQDSHWYLRALEETVIRTCARLGATQAERHEEHTGVWLEGRKVAAVGVALRRWVAFHGVALNVSPDLRAYDAIVPCGLSLEPVGSLGAALGADLALAGVVPIFLEEFAKVFDADVFAADLALPPADLADLALPAAERPAAIYADIDALS